MRRTIDLEEAMPSKADKMELEAAIQELRDEIKKLNIEEGEYSFDHDFGESYFIG
jgi:hypothetical protein